MALALEEKYDQVRQLITMGKERGYLLYDEVNDILPAEVHSSEEIDDLLSTFERYGIDIYEDLAAPRPRAPPWKPPSPSSQSKPSRRRVRREDGELDLTPGLLEKTNDPVRMYLREMGTVPLLTREGEVAIAKRIERGQLLVLKTITRSPIVIKELLAIAEDLRQGARSIKEIVQFDDEELTEEKIEDKTKQTLKSSTRSPSSTARRSSRPRKLEKIPQIQKAPLPARALRRWRARASRCRSWSRSLEFNPFETQAADRQDAPHRGAPAISGARSRQARAPRRRLQGRRRRRSAQGTAQRAAPNCAKSKTPARSASPN